MCLKASDHILEEMGTRVIYVAVQVYRQLAWAYLEAGDKPGPAMSCIRALRDLPLEVTQNSVISFLALNALCQLGKLDEAETELLSVVSSSAVSLATCLGRVGAKLPPIAKWFQQTSTHGQSVASLIIIAMFLTMVPLLPRLCEGSAGCCSSPDGDGFQRGR